MKIEHYRKRNIKTTDRKYQLMDNSLNIDIFFYVNVCITYTISTIFGLWYIKD